MVTYKLVNGLMGTPNSVQRNDGLCIPFNPDNTDYQEYLRWLEAGNTPLPAEEQ